MTLGTEFRRRRSGRLALAVAAAVCALATLPAAGIASEVGDGALSPRLSELAKPAIGSAPPATQAKKLSLAPSGPGSLLRQGGRVLVDVRFDRGAAARLEALREAGAQIVDLSRRYQTVTIATDPADLTAVAEVAGVEAVAEDLAPIVYGAGESPATSSTPTECEGGLAISEGVEQLLAKKARTEFGLTGSGVTVGVLSDSFDKDKSAPTHAAKDVETGDLPGVASACSGQKTPVDVIEDLAGSKSGEEGEDEGRAMLQIVHDMAPGASLAFATAFKSEMSFAQNIEKLAKPVVEGGAGAKVIVDDVAYFAEPFFQDGPVAAAVRHVTEAGAAYFSAAGNNDLLDASGREIASWEAPQFRDSSSCPAAMEAIAELKASHCMDFDPGAGVDNTFGITVAAGATLSVDLQWAEPWNGVATDLDALLLEPNGELALVGGEPVGSAEDNVSGQRPFEFFQWVNVTGTARTVQLAINRYSGGSPRLKFALLENGSGVTETEYPTSTGGDEVGPTIFGHSGSAPAISVAAVRYDSTSAPEHYSSRGPVTHYFGPVAGSSPAAALASPEAIAKPDIAATDCGVTTFFVPPALRFCGTSAAAPHAAGVAALMAQARPGATPAEIRSALLRSAHPVGVFGQCAVGAGLVDAAAAVAQVVSPTSGLESLSCQPPPSTPLPAAAAVAAAVSSKRPPETSFALRPHQVVRTHAKSAFVSFRFRSDEGGTFSCRVDRAPFRPCHRKLARWFSVGGHTVQVAARNAAGEVDPTPAVFRFRVERVK